MQCKRLLKQPLSHLHSFPACPRRRRFLLSPRGYLYVLHIELARAHHAHHLNAATEALTVRAEVGDMSSQPQFSASVEATSHARCSVSAWEPRECTPVTFRTLSCSPITSSTMSSTCVAAKGFMCVIWRVLVEWGTWLLRMKNTRGATSIYIYIYSRISDKNKSSAYLVLV